MLPIPTYGERSKRNWVEIITIFISIGSLFVAGFAIYQSNQATNESKQYYETANNLTQATLELQNITSNFQPEIIPYFDIATLPDISTNLTRNNFGQVEVYGTLNISLIVINPHASIVSLNTFTINATARTPTKNDNSSFLDSNNFFGSDIIVFGEPLNMFNSSQPITYVSPMESFIQPGVSQINFTLPVLADIALNPNFLGIAYGANLGAIKFEIDMKDVQTNHVYPNLLSAPVMLNVYG
jgi:hypothetical protein